MKKNIILALLFSLFCFCSCSREDEQTDGGGVNADPVTRGYIGVRVTDEHDDDDKGFELTDDIRTIRFIVFTDIYTYPKAEVNHYRLIPASEADRAAALQAVFEVSRADKLVVAIANEPDTPENGLTNILNGVETPQDLETLELEMSWFLNDDHLSLRTGKMMPMSGAVWISKNNVYDPALSEAEAASHRVSLSLDRAVARVDIYLTTDVTGDLELFPGSYIELKNTYTKSLFVHHQDDNGHELGRLQTVPAGGFITRGWSIADPGSGGAAPKIPGNSKPVYICSFYTPERNCLTDKLTLDIGVKIPGDDGFKSGRITLSTAKDKSGTTHLIDIVRRNSIYEVTFIIGITGMTTIVNDWGGEEEITWEL